MSHDHRFGITLIAFVGSVFSPYYAFNRRRRAVTDPHDHVALNIAIYGADGYRWAMTERGRASLTRDATSLQIGTSRLAWTPAGTLEIDIDEVALPLPRRIRGRLTVTPTVAGTKAFAIDPAARHVWQPIAPRAEIEVALQSPDARWTGSAYVDHNRGAEPLEAAFERWSWSRSIERDRTRIFYDTEPRSGPKANLQIAYEAQPSPHDVSAPPLQPFGRSLWRLPLTARSDPGTSPRLVERWEDGPFYARSLIEHRIEGETIQSVHEMVALDRFARPIVQAMLPFRMPRRA